MFLAAQTFPTIVIVWFLLWNIIDVNIVAAAFPIFIPNQTNFPIMYFPHQGATEGPAGSTQGEAVVATSSQGGGQPTVGDRPYFHNFVS